MKPGDVFYCESSPQIREAEENLADKIRGAHPGWDEDELIFEIQKEIDLRRIIISYAISKKPRGAPPFAWRDEITGKIDTSIYPERFLNERKLYLKKYYPTRLQKFVRGMTRLYHGLKKN